jgi:SpoVK/Ycf46/Vps4 family AAA+-type ATPase
LQKAFFTRVSPKAIPLKCHLVKTEETQHVLTLLANSSEHPTHILLYGPPGTGKTSYAHGVAKKLGLPTYEVVKGDEDNESTNRRAGITACLNMTKAGQGSLIIVDEADNVLNTRLSWFTRGETQDKGWLNSLLEEPGARMIWITNDIDGIEESVLRRFAFSLHFRPFNRLQRVQLWKSVLRQNKASRLIDSQTIRHLAGTYPVSAGAVDTAVKKALECSPQDREGFHKALEMNLQAHLCLLNGGVSLRNKDTVEKRYSLEGLNTQGDLPATLSQLEVFDRYIRGTAPDGNKSMNLLFYGPPGTGKSELARYIALELNRELLCKRASDLLNPYVGMTERNLAEAFYDAETQEAVLVIDEVDSLLGSRDKALRTWEVSMTNEFLAQMERFRGILVCTTNRLMDLDQAAIRRFNVKIGFDYLTPEGNLIFYQRLLAPLTAEALHKDAKTHLRQISPLAPGDFKVVRDRLSFCAAEDLTHQTLLRALDDEAKIKEVHKGIKRVGF